jgi:exodeoxyribonuclease VIII
MGGPVNFEDYRAIEALNFSTLKAIDRSPLHFEHRRRHALEDNDRMAVGRAVHALVLEPATFERDFAVFEGRRAGKAWEAFEEDNSDRTILRLQDLERAQAIAAAVRRHSAAAALLAQGTPEHTIRWTDTTTDEPCKARLDWINDHAIADLKVTADVSPRRFGALAARMLYHVQLVWYEEAARAVEPLRPARYLCLIAAEAEPPHDVAVYYLEDDQIYAAREHLERLKVRYAECKRLGQWPGVAPTAQPLALPRWLYADEDDLEAGEVEVEINTISEEH